MMKILTLVSVALLLHSAEAQSLKKYNIEPRSATVGGFSSGGAFSTLFHFIHSSEVYGAAIFAGGPYCCGTVKSPIRCLTDPASINVDTLIKTAKALEQAQSIDKLSNVKGVRVFIWQGLKDTIVRPASGPNVQKFCSYFGTNIKAVFNYSAEHGFPTQNYGVPCGSKTRSTLGFTNCNFNGAFESLNWLYSEKLTRPSGGEGNVKNLMQYGQGEFFTGAPSLFSMDTVGFVYVPTACQAGASCKFHIVFHGCSQYRKLLGNNYAVKSGYMDVAEKNRIVILFPQTISTPGKNPTGCWDWFGYTNQKFPTREGAQVLGIYSMMKRVTG